MIIKTTVERSTFIDIPIHHLEYSAGHQFSSTQVTQMATGKFPSIYTPVPGKASLLLRTTMPFSREIYPFMRPL